MKKSYFSAVFLASFFLFPFCTIAQIQNSTNTTSANHLNWKVDPFDHKLFIENRGQFDSIVDKKEKVLYGIQLGSIHAYFTSHKVIYRYDEYPEGEKDPDEKIDSKPITHILTVEWENSNPSVTLEAGEKQTSYYTYQSATKGETIKTGIFKKLTYHNLYPGIDVEYTFPDSGTAIKYTLVVHPGADYSLAKIKYTGATGVQLLQGGNIIVSTAGMGNFIDNAPVSYLADTKTSVVSSFTLNGMEESFHVSNYDKSKTLLIDPIWNVSPAFVTNNAYDLDFDNRGNVYAYGSFSPFQLVKINSLGAIQWTYNTVNIGTSYYGDLAVDKSSGTSYLVAGFTNAVDPILKVNANGILVLTDYHDSASDEMWRAVWDPCDHQVAIGGGGGSAYQAFVLDTNANSTLKSLNPIGAVLCCHDAELITIDQYSKSFFLALCKSNVDPALAPNALLKMPLPTYTPTLFNVNDGYTFQELAGLYGCPGVYNGMNGLAASPNWLYSYDGAVLKRWNKNTGALSTSLVITATSFQWGGLDVDWCDNIYVGDQSSIKVYNSALTLTSTIVLPNTVFDAVLNDACDSLYVCGKGFVSSYSVTPPAVPTITKTKSAPACACTNTATATLMLCGTPDPNVTYLWSNGQTTQTATALCPGVYTVTISFSCSETFTDTVTIAGGGGGLTLGTVQTNEKCFGGATGSATVTVIGGATPYTYTWTPSGGTNATASNLTAGTYTITVKDKNGCTGTATVIITQPLALTATTTNTGVKCSGGSTGSITVTPAGGTPAYTYAWAPSGGSGATASNLSVGCYTATVTDANGCTATAITCITQPPALTVSIVDTSAKCFGGSTGIAWAMCAGGNGTYTYSWTGGQTNQKASNLSAGCYTVTVTDANGCTLTTTACLSNPPALTATTTTLPASCGASDGSATATPGGGTGAYTYSWALSGGTNATASNLTAGNYTVTVTDANGCTVTAAATVTSSGGVTANISSSANITCNGGSDGSVTVTPGGGTPAYTYLWNPSSKTTQTATGLSAGSYTITVTDANGCTATASVMLTQPAAITLTTSTTPALCNGGSTGTATVTAAGGIGAYTYAWAPGGATTATANNLSANTYTVTVTDANGCNVTATATVTQPPALTATTTITSALCNGGSTGTATVTPGGGTGAYTYSWAPGGATGATASNLSANTYTVTVTDANGCTITTTAIVNQPTVLTATTTITQSTCGNANGSATATPAGGTGAYTYSWAPSGGTNATASNLSATIYTVTVKDANGCTVTATAAVTNANSETASITASVNISCNGGTNGSATVTAIGGTAPYTYSWAPAGGTNATASNLTAGSYTVTVKDANGCSVTAGVSLTQPTALTATTTTIPALCNGGATGSATVTTGGGTPAYTYSWAPGGGTNAIASNLTAGTYTITVTDANGCTHTAIAIVAQPTPITPTVTGFPTSCGGGSDGQATVIPAGGSPAYTYAWTPNGGNVANASGLTAGTYTITVTDAKGCTQTATAIVTQPAPILVSFTSDAMSSCAPLCVNFKDLSTDPGGTISKWSWDFGDGGTASTQNPNHCYTNPGIYSITLTVTDNKGCTGTLVISNMVTVYSYPVAAFTLTPQPTTIINPTIHFTDKSTDAYGIATWLWNFNDPGNSYTSNAQNPVHTYSDTGVFCATLTVTNIHGCVDSVTECLVISPQYTLYIPDAFTPNGDNVNDIFLPKGDYIQTYDMYIFDRWGMMLFHSTDITKGWNGTVNGGSRLCEEDTYVYLIEVTDNLGKKHSYMGKVTLIR